MIKKTSVLFSCFFVIAGLFAQQGTHFEVDFTSRLQIEDSIRIIHEIVDQPHVSYFLEASPEDMARLQWRLSSTRSWQFVPIDEHVSYDQAHFSRLQFTERGQSDTLYLRSVEPLTSSFFYHRYHPGSTPISESEEVDLREEDCDCPEPDIQVREDWCGNCPTTATPVEHAPSHLIVHHSAGPNSSSDWAAVVRSIWDFHVNGRGWNDIGYHYLIDPNGKIYLGRADDIQGAHFCAQNRNAMGICVLGTFTNVSPAPAARAAWVDLAAYAACKWEVSPQSRSIHASSGLNLLGVSGHRDGCATACPGQELYGQLGEWRSDLRSRMDACSEEEEDALVLVAMPSPFPYAADLSWSGGVDDLREYRLKIRELNSGIFGSWQLSFSPSQQNHRLGLQAGEKYEFVIESWSAEGKLQESNTVSWTTDAWRPATSSMSVTPNPVVAEELSWVWTDAYRGDFKLSWVSMSGQQVPLGNWTKNRDTYVLVISRNQLPSGMHFLYVSYGDREEVLPVMMQ